MVILTHPPIIRGRRAGAPAYHALTPYWCAIKLPLMTRSSLASAIALAASLACLLPVAVLQRVCSRVGAAQRRR